ncbi:MAG: hypothetical protein M1401_13385 [Chloroflexi bacterium]|nr:hypothetical protein [Chloroflexota bacterium]MDA8217306.1 hypothetical protein [Dehalococcoidales bacterium]
MFDVVERVFSFYIVDFPHTLVKANPNSSRLQSVCPNWGQTVLLAV